MSERMAEYWVHGGDLRDDDGGHPFSAAQGERRVVLATDHATAAAALREAQERIAELEAALSDAVVVLGRFRARSKRKAGEVTAAWKSGRAALKGGNDDDRS